MNGFKSRILGAALAVAGLSAPANAAVTMNAFNDGSNVAMEFAGTLDLTGMVLTGGGSAAGLASITTTFIPPDIVFFQLERALG